MRILLFFIALIFHLPLLFSQTQVGLKTVTISDERKINEELIEELGSALLTELPDDVKDSVSNELKELLTIELSKKEAFTHSFKKVKSFSILTPKDSSFRIFNWSIPYLDGTHSYECGILKRNDSLVKFMTLQDSLLDKETLKNFSGNSENWIGGLYYEIIEKKNKLNTYYTLLAWDGNNLMTNKKHIDVLWFDQSNAVHFGAPIFETNRRKFSRVLFEFGGQNSMRLFYDDDLDRIVFDHLSPPRSSLEGIYEYYGADFTYDAYQWENDKWVLMKEIIPQLADPKNRTEAKILDRVLEPEDAVNKKSIEQYKKVENPK